MVKVSWGVGKGQLRTGSGRGSAAGEESLGVRLR